MTSSTRRPDAISLFDAMRPNQWTKNVLVLAAFFFAFWDRSRTTPLGILELLRAIAAAGLFSIVSSGVYVFNDIRDLAADRRHPVKKFRPIASGRVPVPRAAVLSVSLVVLGLAGAWALAPAFGVVVTGYTVMQFIYTVWLRRVALVDILIIAGGFVLRALAGAVVLPAVTISPWLLLCTFLLALFLALCKRRHEKNLFVDGSLDSRPSLQKYDVHLLDLLIAVTSSATIVSYAIYTLWPQTVEKFGTSGLGFTIPFVIFGIFRYMDLAFRHEKGGRPERILLSDVPLIINLALYGLTALLVFMLQGH